MPAMSEDKASSAIEGFLSEHGRCWRLSGEDLEMLEDQAALWLTCPGCDASVVVSKTC